jgi:hypothetical protein
LASTAGSKKGPFSRFEAIFGVAFATCSSPTPLLLVKTGGVASTKKGDQLWPPKLFVHIWKKSNGLQSSTKIGENSQYFFPRNLDGEQQMNAVGLRGSFMAFNLMPKGAWQEGDNLQGKRPSRTPLCGANKRANMRGRSRACLGKDESRKGLSGPVSRLLLVPFALFLEVCQENSDKALQENNTL